MTKTIAAAIMIVMSAVPAFAEMARYTDNAGVVHYVSSPEAVPQEYRAGATAPKLPPVTTIGNRESVTEIYSGIESKLAVGDFGVCQEMFGAYAREDARTWRNFGERGRARERFAASNPACAKWGLHTPDQGRGSN